VDRAGRKFYFGETHFVKRLDFDLGEQHRGELQFQRTPRDQLVREIGVHLMLRDRHIANIAQMVDWEITPQHGSIVFDRLPRRLLSGDFEQMSSTALGRAIIDIIAGVQHLRASGVFHSDNRLYSIVVDHGGNGTLIDFGLAGPLEIETNEAGMKHLILAAATRISTRGEYPDPRRARSVRRPLRFRCLRALSDHRGQGGLPDVTVSTVSSAPRSPKGAGSVGEQLLCILDGEVGTEVVLKARH
jgi:serine/threonine protein kinase